MARSASSSRSRSRLRVRAALLVALTGCYHPSPPEGAPCTTTSQCPTPQRCVLGACALHDPEVDAGRDQPDAQVVAPIDAAAPPVDAARLPCTTAGLACSGTATTFSCGGSCWVLCTGNAAREAARAACVGWSGALGRIDDATEQACVASHVNNPAWLGLIQLDTALTPQTDWTWNLATPVVYTHWQSGTPNDRDGHENGEEQCGKLQSDGTWDDIACTTAIDFLCERP